MDRLIQTRRVGHFSFYLPRYPCDILLAIAFALLATTGTGLSQAAVQFSTTNYVVSESAGTVTLTAMRSGETNSAAMVDYVTADGTATNGGRYVAVQGTLAFDAGEISKSIQVPILNNGIVDGTQSFQVTLRNATEGLVLGANTNATVYITDNDVGVQFVFAHYSVEEDAGAVVVCVVRGDDGIQPLTVDLATVDQTATSGLDYTGTTNTLQFAGTERYKEVTIPILNDSAIESNETFLVALFNPIGATLGSQYMTTVTILDKPPGFHFESSASTVAEDAGIELINVLRGSGVTDATTTVDFATADSSATAGLDYAATNGTLSFVPGEQAKQIPVTILNDGIREDTESFDVVLDNPSGGAVLGPETTNVVSILDNDPGVGFEATNYPVWGRAGEIELTVVRGNDGSLGPFSVDYATTDETALAGRDYQAASGTLQFEQNETLKSLTIPILSNNLVGGMATFQVTLSNPTGDAVLGNAATTVTILEYGYHLSVVLDPTLAIQRDGPMNLLSWAGAGPLQRADRVTGPWQTLSFAQSPYTVRSPVPTTFYRVGGQRPVYLFVPSSYDGQTPIPLVILLHAHGSSGLSEEDYLDILPLAEDRGFFYCFPNAILDAYGYLTWNAYFTNSADAAAFGETYADDVGYLRGLIAETERHFTVDRKRVYVIGHSNGGYMAHRLAGDASDIIAGIASLAGVPLLPGMSDRPTEPVNILQIHGTADGTVPYADHVPSNPNAPLIPGAVHTIEIWADYNGAHNPVTDAAPSMDLDLDVAGLDTVVTRYQNYPPGGAVELWTINGGNHFPTISPIFSASVIDWLLAHPKP